MCLTVDCCSLISESELPMDTIECTPQGKRDADVQFLSTARAIS